MIVNLYVSDEECSPRFGLIAHDRPVSLLPGRAEWRHVRDLDIRELALPEAIEEEIDRCGYWATRNRLLRREASRADDSPGSPDRDLTGIRLPSPGFP